MITTATPRRRAGQRIASALWGLLVIGAGVMMAVAFSGYDIDLELTAIIALTAVGVWLVLSAALSSLGRSREVREATAPVVEEPLDTDPTPTTPTPAAPSAATPTEVIFTDAASPATPSDSTNRDEPRHAEDATAPADVDGEADADPVHRGEREAESDADGRDDGDNKPQRG